MGKVVEFNTHSRRLNNPESFDRVETGSIPLNSDPLNSDPLNNGPVSRDYLSEDWIPDAVLLALARSYIVKAAQLTRRVRGADDSLAWMLEDMADILARGESSPQDTKGDQAISQNKFQ